MTRYFLLLILTCIMTLEAAALDPVAMYGKPWEKLSREQRRAFWRKRTVMEYEPTGRPSPDRIDYYLKVFKEKNIFDPKVTVFDVRAEDRGGTLTLTGEVLLPNYKSGLTRTLEIIGLDRVENHIRVLPDPALGLRAYAVVTTGALAMTRSPLPRSEQLNQILIGEPVRLLKTDESGDYFMVQGPDAYIGWVEARGLRRMMLDRWSASRRIPESDETMRRRIEDIARPIMGIPYVWGGITQKGMDCSGLTQYIYKNLGLNLPRDADEQSNLGRLVAFREYRDNLRAGDLLFFAGGSGRISHVAISLGGDEYLQSTGRDGVHLSSFDPESPDYDEETLKKFVFARRLIRAK